MDLCKPYLILGTGNCLMSDDGAGVHAARILQAEPPPETTVLATETDFLCAISSLERCSRALVIDAMDAGEQPGTLYYCRGEDLVQTSQRHSLHGLGLLGALEFLDRKHGPELHVLGIQPGLTKPGRQLSPEVASVLPQVVRMARRIIFGFGRLDSTDLMATTEDWKSDNTMDLHYTQKGLTNQLIKGVKKL